MKIWFVRSIARRLFLTVLAASAAVWVAVYLQGLVWVYLAGSGNFDRELHVLTHALANTVQTQSDEPALAIALQGARATVDARAQVLGEPADFSAFNVWRRDGTRLASSANAPAHEFGQPTQAGFFDAELAGVRYRVHREIVADGRFRIETLQTTASRRQVFDEVMLSTAGLLVPLAVGVPLLLLPAWLAVRAGLRPLSRLSGELATREPHDLEPLRTPHVYAELAPVVGELNAAMQRIRAMLQREREFLADAAHELRTPLAVIAAQCELLVHTRSASEREQAELRLRSGVARASRVVNQLLVLARLQAEVEDEPVPVDLANLARETLALHEGEARARSIGLAYGGPDRLRIHGPRQAIESALGNLVGNAIRYGREGGLVELEITLDAARGLRVAVCDDGPGIPAELRSVVLERFRRGPNPGASGSGLGLAIVASAARHLGADLAMQDGPAGTGLCVSLTWHAHEAA